MIDWLIWGIAIFAALLLFHSPILNFIEDLVHRDGGHARRTREFHDAGRAAGLTYQDRVDEIFLNEAMARFRRLASDYVTEEPDLWTEGIDRAQQEAFDFVAAAQRHLLPAFAQKIKGLSYGQILYPAQARMIDAKLTGRRDLLPTEDQFAALRRVKPG